MTHQGQAPRFFLIGLSFCLALPATAADLAWPAGTEQVMARTQAVADFRLATGPYQDGILSSQQVNGTLSEEILRLPLADSDPAQMATTLRAQLTEQGYQIGFACADKDCGGFDFRFALPIAQGPDMYVDLGDFHYLTARRTSAAGVEDVAITLSRGGRTGYAHIAQIGDAAATPPRPLQVLVPDQSGLIDQLLGQGRAVLDDLTFATGASALSGNRYDSLVMLSGWLADNSDRRVVLVGHTDASGALDTNTALSQARAEAVRRALMDDHGTNSDQVSAAGVGYLSPRAPNTTPAGRDANRRVEVVLLAK